MKKAVADQIDNLNHIIEKSVTGDDIHRSRENSNNQRVSQNRKPKSALGYKTLSRVLRPQNAMAQKNQSQNAQRSEHGRATSNYGEQLPLFKIQSDTSILDLDQHGLAFSPALSTPENKSKNDCQGPQLGSKKLNQLLQDIIKKQRDLDALKNQIKPLWLEEQSQVMQSQTNLTKAYAPPTSFGMKNIRPKTSMVHPSRHSTVKKSNLRLTNASGLDQPSRERGKGSVLRSAFQEKMKPQSQILDGGAGIEVNEVQSQIQNMISSPNASLRKVPIYLKTGSTVEEKISPKEQSKHEPEKILSQSSQMNPKKRQGVASVRQLSKGLPLTNYQSPTSLKLDLSNITRENKKQIQINMQGIKRGKRNRRNISMTQGNPFVRESQLNLDRIVRQNCDKMLTSQILSLNNHTYKHCLGNETQKAKKQTLLTDLKLPTQFGSLSPDQKTMFLHTNSPTFWNNQVEVQHERDEPEKAILRNPALTPNQPIQTSKIFDIQKSKFKQQEDNKVRSTRIQPQIELTEELKSSLEEGITTQSISYLKFSTQSKRRPEDEINLDQYKRIKEELDVLKQQMKRRKQTNDAVIQTEEERKGDPMSNSDFFQRSLGQMSQIQEEAKIPCIQNQSLDQNSPGQLNVITTESAEQNPVPFNAVQENTPQPEWYKLAFVPQSMIKRFTAVIPPKPQTTQQSEQHQTQEQSTVETVAPTPQGTKPPRLSFFQNFESNQIPEGDIIPCRKQTEIIIIQEPPKPVTQKDILSNRENNPPQQSKQIRVGSVEDDEISQSSISLASMSAVEQVHLEIRPSQLQTQNSKIRNRDPRAFLTPIETDKARRFSNIEQNMMVQENSDHDGSGRLGESGNFEDKLGTANNRNVQRRVSSPLMLPQQQKNLSSKPENDSLLNPLSTSILLRKKTMLIQQPLPQKSGKQLLDSKKIHQSKYEATENSSDSESFISSKVESSEKMDQTPKSIVMNTSDIASRIQKFSTFTKHRKASIQKTKQEINLDVLCQQYSKYNQQELAVNKNKVLQFAEAEECLRTKRDEEVKKFELRNDSLGKKFLEKRFDLDLRFHEVNLHYTFNLILNLKTTQKENKLMSHEVMRAIHVAENEGMYSRIFNQNNSKLKSKLAPSIMLVHSYDLNFKQIKDPNSAMKVERNWKFIKTDEPTANDEDGNGLVMLKLGNFFRRSLIPHRYFLGEKEDQIKTKFRTYLRETLLVQRSLMLIRDTVHALQDHMTYLELFLCSSGYLVKEEAQLIKIIHPDQLDQFVNPVLLNSLKAKAEVEGFEDLLDFKMVEYKLQLFITQIQQQRKALSNKLLRSINKYLQQLGVSDYQMQKMKFSKMDAKILAQLEKKQIKEICSPFLAMPLKVSSCLKQLIDLIHSSVILESRFHRTKALLGTSPSYVRAKRNEERNLVKFDRKNLPFSFSDYPAFIYVGNLRIKEISKLIFSHNKYSLYKHLIVQENDVIMYALLDHLRKQSIKRINNKKTMLTGSYEMLFGNQNMLVYPKPVQRSKTIRVLPRSQLAYLTRRKNQLFGPLVDKTRLTRFNSLIYEESPYHKAIMINRFTRQFTENIYDVILCEYAIHELLKFQKDKIKDSQSIFYKNIWRWIDLGDNNMNNEFRAEFCFKSQITRDLEYPTMIMEVFKATEISTARMRIKKFTNKPIKRRLRQIVSKGIIERFKEFEEKQVKPKPQITKHLKSIMPQEFHTDDSMKDINFDDVKSDTDSDGDQQDQADKLVKEEQRQSLLMKGHQTSLEYYQTLYNLKKKHMLQRRMTRLLKKPKVFKVLSSSQYDQQDPHKNKNMQRLINQINLTVVDAIIQVKHEVGDEIIQMNQSQVTQVVQEEKIAEGENEGELQTARLGSDQEHTRKAAESTLRMQRIVKSKMLSMKTTRRKIGGLSSESLQITHLKSLKFVNALNHAKTLYVDNGLEEGNELDLLQQAKSIKLQKKLMNQSKLHRYNIIKQLQNQKKQCRFHGNGHSVVNNNHQLLKNLKLSKQMKTITQKLGIQFQLELPKQDHLPQVLLAKKKQYSEDPEQHQKFKEEIFQIIHARNYAKIEDMLKRYYVTTWNLQTDRGDSLLTMAVNMGDYKMVHILLTRGMNPNTKNKDGDTALHFAINGNHILIAGLLISFGANENIKNNEGLTPWALQQRR